MNTFKRLASGLLVPVDREVAGSPVKDRVYYKGSPDMAWLKDLLQGGINPVRRTVDYSHRPLDWRDRVRGLADYEVIKSYKEQRPFPTDDEVASVIRAVNKHHSDTLYLVYNATAATTAAPVKQPTGTAIRTMMQLKCATTPTTPGIVEWGCSFDGNAAATPGQVELIETGAVGATVLSTAYATTDVQPYNNASAPANTSGTSGVPLNLGTSASGFSTAAVTEGSTTASRMADAQLIAPTNQYLKQWPLGREFQFGYYAAAAAAVQNYLRVRATFGTTINMYVYVVFLI